MLVNDGFKKKLLQPTEKTVSKYIYGFNKFKTLKYFNNFA